MNIRGKEKDIVDIRLGHESESYAMGWVIENNKSESHKADWQAYEDGFEQGIRFIANYLSEYGINIELYDKVVDVKQKDDWYSGTIIEKEI